MPSTMRHTGESEPGPGLEPPSAPGAELSLLSGESTGAAAAMLVVGRKQAGCAVKQDATSRVGQQGAPRRVDDAENIQKK